MIGTLRHPRRWSWAIVVWLGLALPFALLSGCAELRLPTVGEGIQTAGDRIQDVLWDFEKRLRAPGDKLLTRPEAVWSEQACSEKPLPFFKLEEHAVLPPKAVAGKEVNHRIIYAMCPERPTEVVRGDLYRRIYYKGQVVFEDVAKRFEVKPGKWSVDAFITIPREAEAGVYALETAFSGGRIEFKDSRTLIVSK
jgi:hypothetical protein